MKMKKRFLSILLSLSLVLGLMPGLSLTALADGTYSGGTGTEDDPYLISTVDDWKALAASVNGGEAYGGKYFRQTADLDMSGAGSLNPVGTLEHPFAGKYEGDGFAISNAAITGMACSVQGYNMNVAGLFVALVGSGSISNLKVTNVSVTATSGSGGWDQAYAGGLVAFAENCTITDCSVSNSTITAGNSNIFAGAFVGFAGAENSEKTAFSKCASENNTVNTYDYGGGFIGAIVNETSSNDAILFTDCYSAKNTADAGTHTYGTVGGFLGGSQGGNVTVRNGFVYGCSAVATGTGSGKGVFTGDTTYGTVQASNTYYYDTQNLSVNADSATSKTVDDMKSLASTLGNAFSQGSNYPILLHQVNLEVSIEGWTYGEDANEPSVTRNSSGTPTYTYADKGTTDFSATVPSNAGDYTVKATVEKTATYKAAEATADFTIAKATPAITVPAPNAVTYDPAKTLANVTLPTGWAWENENTVPTVDNNGYTAEYTVSDDTNYDYSGVEGYSAETHKVTRTVELTVNKATAVAATVTANNRTYDGTEKPLVTADNSTLIGGEMQYALGTATEANEPYTTSIPAKTEAGTYYVWYRVEPDDNHNDCGPYPVTVAILSAKMEPKAPTGNELVYNGQEQPLVKAGEVKGGTLVYAIGQDGKTAPGKADFKETLPARKDAGTYYVWYMVKGDKNHNDTEPVALEAEIAKKSLVVSAEDKSKTYGDADPELTWTQEGLVEGDPMTVVLKREAGENLGGHIITVDRLEVSDNYTKGFNEAVLTINAREATVTAVDQTIAEGESIKTDVSMATLSGGAKGDRLVAVTLAASAVNAFEAYGTITPSGAKIVNAAGENVTGNYSLTYAAGKLTVNPYPIPEPDFTLLARMTVSGSSKTALKIAWTKVAVADGYDVYFVKCGKEYKSKPKATVTGRSVKVTGLKKRTEYKAYVRAWARVKGKKVYLGDSPEVHAITGGYDAKRCNIKSITLNKTKLNLKVGRSATLKATLKGVKSGKKLLSHARKVRYYSSNVNVATVSRNGKVKAIGKGRCTIYAIANNGVRTSVKVTVK